METQERGSNYVPPPGFTQEQRRVFFYNDGNGQVAGDPMEIMYRTSAFMPDQYGVLSACHAGEDTEAEWEELDKALTAPLPKEAEDQRKAMRATWAAEQLDGYERLMAAVRQIFKMAPYDPIQGTGANWQQCMRVWNDFQDWAAAKKKKQDTSPTKSPSSEPDASAPPSTTPPTSASSVSTEAA